MSVRLVEIPLDYRRQKMIVGGGNPIIVMQPTVSPPRFLHSRTVMWPFVIADPKNKQFLSEKTKKQTDRLNEPMNYRPNNIRSVQTTVIQTKID